MHYNELTPYGGVIMALCMALAAVSGVVLIPFFRFYKTGFFEAHIGDRLRKDDSSPRFGGVLMMGAVTAGVIGGVYVLSRVNTTFDRNDIKRLTAALVYAFFVFIAGFLQDYLKQKLRRPAGLKLPLLFLYLWAVSAAFLVSLRLISGMSGKVLLPFRLGFLGFGVLYYPVTGLVMAISCFAFMVHDTFGGEEEYCCDGLLGVTTVLMSLFFAAMTDYECSLLGYITAGSAAGLLVWSLFPSKIYFGESGQLLCASLFCAMCILSKRELLLIILPVSVIIDMLASLLRYVYYRLTKKVLLHGGSLHAHLKKKGINDISIIMLSLPFTLAGIAAAAAFYVYSLDIL